MGAGAAVGWEPWSKEHAGKRETETERERIEGTGTAQENKKLLTGKTRGADFPEFLQSAVLKEEF